MPITEYTFPEPSSGFFGFASEHTGFRHPSLGDTIGFRNDEEGVTTYKTVFLVMEFSNLLEAHSFFDNHKFPSGMSVLPSYEEACKQYRAQGYDVGCPYTFVGFH